MVFLARHYEIRSDAPPKEGSATVDHEWDDPRAQDAYATDHRYTSFPYGSVAGVNPGMYADQAAYYEAQHGAYVAQLYYQEDVIRLAHGAFPFGSTAWASTDLPVAESNKVDLQDQLRKKARESVYQQALNLAAHIEENPNLNGWDPWKQCHPWLVTLRRLQLAIEAYEDGDETETELKERLNRYLDYLELAPWVLLPRKQPEPRSTPPPNPDPPRSGPEELEEPGPQGRWRRFKQWLYE